MIKIFRNFRKNLLNEGKTSKYFKYAIGEIVLVVVGILIALQINNWNENRKAQALELSSMKEIIENINYDILRCDRNIKTNTILVKGLDSLRTAIHNTFDGKDETVEIYYFTLKYVTDYSRAVLNRTAYEELTNSGAIKGIANRTLVRQLSDYYQRITFAVNEFRPERSHQNLQTLRKKFISFKGLDSYITSFDKINPNSFFVDYDFEALKQMEHLKLLEPEGLLLEDYYNEIAQYAIDQKTYIFYMAWVKETAEMLIRAIEKEYQLTETTL